MRRTTLLATLLLLAVGFTPAGTADEHNCDYVYRDFVGAGATYVQVMRHRCTTQFGDVTYTERLEQYDVYAYDPFAPEGNRHVATLHLSSAQTDYPDGTTKLRHRTYVAAGDTSMQARYDGTEDPQGRVQCTGAVTHERGSTTTHVGTPPLPACWPTGLLLP